MAGICEGGGLTIDGDGRLVLAGVPELAWGPVCSIEDGTGLRIDPGTGKVWTPKHRALHTQASEPALTAAVTVAGTYALGDPVVLETVAPACSPFPARFVATLSGGYFGQRMGNGNWWAAKRFVTVWVNGVVVGFTGSQTVASLENNSGGVLNAGAAVDALTITALVPAGQTVKVQASYQHERLSFTASPANGYEWRPPTIDGFMFLLET